jgi:hypothetical protein
MRRRIVGRILFATALALAFGLRVHDYGSSVGGVVATVAIVWVLAGGVLVALVISEARTSGDSSGPEND